MHRVVQSHLNTFKQEFDLAYETPKAFEAFISYIIIRQFFRDVVTPDDHIYSGHDPGIDTILFVDGELVSSS